MNAKTTLTRLWNSLLAASALALALTSQATAQTNYRPFQSLDRWTNPFDRYPWTRSNPFDVYVWGRGDNRRFLLIPIATSRRLPNTARREIRSRGWRLLTVPSRRVLMSYPTYEVVRISPGAVAYVYPY